MSSPPSYRDALVRLAETLAIGAAGGAVLGLARFPAGWLSGALIAVAAAAMARRPVLVPDILVQAAFVVLGISLGSAVTPESVARMSSWPLSLAVLALAMSCGTAAVVFYLQRVHGWDLLSALFASTPGGLSQALAFAAEAGSDLPSVAMVQSVRVLVLTAVLPLGLAAFGVSGVPPPAAGPTTVASLGELVGLVVLAAAGGMLFYRLRVPGGLLVGAMAVSSLLHGTGIVSVGLPPTVAIAAVVVFGSIIGARFAGIDIWLLRRLCMVGLGALAVGTSVACVVALATSALLALPVGDVVVAFAPGALEAMTTLAFVLHLDPAYVGTHHIARLMFVALMMPFVVHAIRRRQKAP